MDAEPRALACRSVRLRPSNLTIAAVLILLAPIVLALAIYAAMLAGVGGLLVLALIAPIAASVGVLEYLGRARANARLELVASGLRVRTAGGERTIEFARILTGYALDDRRTVVVCLSNGERITAELLSGTPAEVLAHCLSQRAPTLPLRGQLGAFTRTLLAFISTCFVAFPVALVLGARFGGWAPLVTMVAALLPAVFVFNRLGSPRIVVGADGIRLLGILRPKFIPYSEVAGVEKASPGLHVRLRSGRTLVLPTIAQDAPQVSDLLRRLAQGIDEYVAAEARLNDVLARRGQSLAAWKEEISRLALAGGGFRTQQLGPQDFELILGDATAAADRRIGAALALQALDETGAGERIRIASSTIANDRLRVALDAAREGALDEALIDAACDEAHEERST